MEIHDAARRLRVADLDMLHAVDNSMAVEDSGEDPDRWPVVGPDRADSLVEVVVLVTDEGTELVIHAMPLRRSTGGSWIHERANLRTHQVRHPDH